MTRIGTSSAASSYEKLVPLIQAIYPRFTPVAAYDIVWRTTPSLNHNLLRMLGLADYADRTEANAIFSPDSVTRSDVNQTVTEDGPWETYVTETASAGPAFCRFAIHS